MLSWLTVRLIDRNRRLDYLLALLFGSLPIGIAYLIGAAKDAGEFKGYLSRPSWVSLAIIAPLVLYVFRWAVSRVAPVASVELGSEVPKVIALVGDKQGRAAAYAAFRQMVIQPWTLGAALLVALAINVLDGGLTLGPYLQEFQGHAVTVDTLPEKLTDPLDWSVMFVGRQGVSPAANLILVMAAYSVQGFPILIGLLFVAISWRHNWFFLRRIFQRRLIRDHPDSYIVVDVEDGDRCFGFRAANEAFNTQVLCLTLGALFLVITRFTHYSGAETAAGLWAELTNLSFAKLYPWAGQWITPVGWIVASMVIALPAAVKLLPLLPLDGKPTPDASVVTYMREFLPERLWSYAESPSREEVDYLASRFASNAFWPTGDNRARRLFFFAYWGLLVVALPIAKPGLNAAFLLYLAGGAAFASAATFVLIAGLGLVLKGVDERLIVVPEKEPEPPASLKARRGKSVLRRNVFISYRRSDAQAWAGRLEASLEDRKVAPAEVFRDISDIGAGFDWANVLDKEIEKAHVVLVVIGPTWVSSGRLKEAGDMVCKEVRESLGRGKQVIPVLVAGAAMPSETALPAEIGGLCRWNAFDLSDSRWDYDVDRLVEAIGKLGNAAQAGT